MSPLSPEPRMRPLRRACVGLLVFLLAAGASATVGLAPAQAAVPPVTLPTPADTLHAYGGIVYGSAQIGNRVYIAGTFTQVGYNDGTRINQSYLAAFDATTGRLDPGFTAQPNGEVHTLLASADGTQLFAGGAATTYRGVAVGRLASLNPVTGAPKTTFKPKPGAKVWSLAQTGNVLWLGGDFTTVNSVTRGRFAAVNATTGALDPVDLPFNAQVRQLTAAPDGSRVYVAGAFESVSGTQRYNFASIDVASRTLTAWDPEIRAHGWGIGLSPDGSVAYVTTSDGDDSVCNADHEAIIAMQAVAVGVPARLWRQASPTDCVYNSGDVNAIAVTGNAVYVGGHLALMSDGRAYRSHLAALDPATGEPLAFNPNIAGSKGVLSLNVTSAGLLVGGDFDTSGGKPNSRFVVFPRSSTDTVAPGKPMAPKVTSRVAGAALVRWQTVLDGTDNTVTYSVLRDDNPTPVHVVTGPAVTGRSISWTDATQAVGTSHKYKIAVSDGTTTVTGANAPLVKVSAADQPVPYAAAVLTDTPSSFWRLSETAPSQPAADASPNGATGVYSTPSAQLGEGGAIAGDPSDALFTTGYNGDDGARPAVSSAAAVAGPQTFTLETWIRTTTKSGGKIIGFGDNQFGRSGNYDRHIYMTNTGTLIFGVYNGTTSTVSSAAGLNNGAWHHVVASLGSTGMHLSVDGAEVASRADVTSAQAYNGFWKVGGDNLSGWPSTAESQTSNKAFAGAVDDVAIYPTELSAAQVAAHYAARQ